MNRSLALLATLFFTAAAAPASGQAAAVRLDRFDGRWFEIARNPNDIQRPCRRARIDFLPTPRPTRYDLTVTCTRASDGQEETLQAHARVTDTTTNAKFRFSLAGLLGFGGIASQQYWVWDHAPDYSWALMGLPDKSNWWIWHREPAPSATVRAATLGRARTLGFDTAGVIQTGL